MSQINHDYTTLMQGLLITCFFHTFFFFRIKNVYVFVFRGRAVSFESAKADVWYLGNSTLYFCFKRSWLRWYSMSSTSSCNGTKKFFKKKFLLYQSEFELIKKYRKLPFGQLPLLEIDGTSLFIVFLGVYASTQYPCRLVQK